MRPQSNYRLGITCCFCGGSIDVDEASRTTLCRHCGSVLRIERRSSTQVYYVADSLKRREIRFLVDRHLKDNGEPLSSGWGKTWRVFIPYWRVRGTCISVREKSRGMSIVEADEFLESSIDEVARTQVRIGPKEITICADDTREWGLESLGIRSQVLRLIPATRTFRDENHLLPTTVSLDDARERLHDAAKSISLAVSASGSNIVDSIVGTEVALIYFPLWIAQFSSGAGRFTVQFDPFAKRVVSLAEGDFDISTSGSGDEIGNDSVSVLPHRCPNCGVDLPAGEMSCAHYCSNCRRLYSDGGNGYRHVELNIPEGCAADQKLLPFWVFDIAGSLWHDKSSFLQALKLLRFRDDLIIIPAFGISNPSKLLRLVTYYNRRRDHFAFENRLPSSYTFIDVVMQSEQTASMIAPLISAIKSIEGYRMYEGEINEVPELAEPELIWLPFALDRYFWREQITGASIEKAAVRI
jgi:predicted RNA-binding Zn-ribbon protein involved in translation (DUF1610 family)